jgi:hypothetical protein
MTREAGENRWAISDPILVPGPEGLFDHVAVKDPSVVFFKGMWHVFYTARSKAEYTTGYVSAKTLEGLQSAARYELRVIRGKSRYGCAPQILYYEPQRKWVLIFQNRDSNYQPAFSTTSTISRPESWSKPQPLIRKDTCAKWIDFWVICDRTKAYLFYTQEHKDVIVRSTDLDKFPRGWSEAKMVFDGVHEAVHVYKVRGQNEFHMIYELNTGGVRSFGLANSEALSGPWAKVTDRYATGDQLEYTGKTSAWTEMVSHGELLRSGYNEQMEYEPKGCRWLVQGFLTKDLRGPYPSLPWKLGITTKIESGGEQNTDVEKCNG